jgi:hypothetical protein
MPLEQEIDDDIDIKILGVPPPGLGMPFLDSDTCTEGGGIYFCQNFFSLMDDGTDGWMEKASRKTTTMSFTICNERKTCPVSGFLKKENLNQITACYSYFINPQRPISFHKRTGTFLGGYLILFFLKLRTVVISQAFDFLKTMHGYDS